MASHVPSRLWACLLVGLLEDLSVAGAAPAAPAAPVSAATISVDTKRSLAGTWGAIHIVYVAHSKAECVLFCEVQR